MTVMLDRFFGVHPEIVRSGVLKDMSEGEIRLYLALMERSEYRRNRELTFTDRELRGTCRNCTENVMQCPQVAARTPSDSMQAYRPATSTDIQFATPRPASPIQESTEGANQLEGITASHRNSGRRSCSACTFALAESGYPA